ncbi:hypothetical protein [Ulvibacter antarcticus]|uniref:Phasin protein n=1 Tax=Ulvibacter antarcticus TaxID=442714 RepID=A0A3L9YDG0_9FLAO|nr:hypothetical protein [Ulvibacter antarcticus]RMA58691.1 hypothetical protein BXY75_2066 [Ulvibacter antarcticus]
MTTKMNKAKTGKINSTMNTVLSFATKANDFALSTTEKVASKSIEFTEKCLGVSNSVVKQGLKITATQQDMVFDALETVKGKVVKPSKKKK